MARNLLFQVKTDTGLVRDNNEDDYLILEESGLFGVCDGLGGHAAGEIASKIAVDTLREKMATKTLEPARQLTVAVDDANSRILKDQQLNPDRMGMGTTLSLLWFLPPGFSKAWIAHIGDSRIYRLRNRKLDQLTDDHSPLYRLYKEGSLGKEELRHHPQKNLIERSLGLSLTVNCDIFQIDPDPGDTYLLCTDGLSDCVSDDEIAGLCRDSAWDDLGYKLVALALSRGGYDNITIVTVKVTEDSS